MRESTSEIPKAGQLVKVRSRSWLVGDVVSSIESSLATLVKLTCADDDAQGQPLDVYWEHELDGAFIEDEGWNDVASKGFDGSVLHTFFGDAVGDELGGSVSGAGDQDGDGYADLIVGVSGNDDNGAESGSAVVFSGFDGSILSTFYGSLPFDRFGFSLSVVGGLTRNGFPELIVGTIYSDINGTSSGSVRVIGVDRNSAPVASDDVWSTVLNTSTVIPVTDKEFDSDGDTLVVISLTQPANGMTVANGDGKVSYTPANGFTGIDSFGYTLSDGNGGFSSATITVEVSRPNRLPIAVADVRTMDGSLSSLYIDVWLTTLIWTVTLCSL